MRLRTARLALGAALATAASAAAPAAAAQDRGAAALGTLVAGLGTSARVLVIGAHPDDDDAALVAFLSRGRHTRTAYLSLTRGEGGTNLVGSETGDALGVVRTAESLAARRVDGAELYFARAYDFGLSKTAAETLERWGRVEGPDAALADVVTVVRAFRPHVVVTLHDGSPRDGHGHHQAAGRIARAAFAVAADSLRYQDRGRPWTPTALYRLARPDDLANDAADIVRLNVGEYAPLLGRTYAELGAESRSRHRTQGGAAPGALGESWVALRLLAGPPSDGARTLFHGIDTTLARVRRAAATSALADAIDSLAPAIAGVRAAYRADDPTPAVAPLAALVRAASRAAALAGVTSRGAIYDPDVARSLEDQWRAARDALVIASGVVVEATAERETVARATAADATDTLRVSVAVHNRGGVPARADFVTMTGAARVRLAARALVAPGGVWRGTLAVAPRFVTLPWWRVGGRLGDLYASTVDGRPERELHESNEAGALHVTALVNIAGADVAMSTPVVHRPAEPSRVAERPVAVVPGVTLRFDRAAEYARAGVPLARPLRLTLQSSYASARDVEVTLVLPPGLAADSARRTVTLPAGATGVLTYVLRGTPQAQRYGIAARAVVGADTVVEGVGTLQHDHLPPLRVYFPAAMALEAVPISLPPRAYVAYVSAGGDGIPLLLSQLGLAVTQLDPSGLTLPSADLSRFTAVVIGPRAYESSPALLSANGKLFEFARAGGTVVVQGGQYLMEQPGVLPYPIAIGRPPHVVTEEGSPVRVADSRAPVLTTPNALVDADFAGWAQERASFVPASFDPRWQAPLEVGDSGEPGTRGALLVARVGRGAYVYTTLSLARQLGAANPGAARLFVNLLAARPRAAAPARPR